MHLNRVGLKKNHTESDKIKEKLESLLSKKKSNPSLTLPINELA